MKAQVSDIEFAEIIEGYLDFEKKVYIDISGEQDPIQEVETYTNMLMLMAQNPNILQDPSLRDMLETLMAKTGIQTNLGNGGGAAPQAPPAQIAAGAPGAGTPGAPQA